MIRLTLSILALTFGLMSDLKPAIAFPARNCNVMINFQGKQFPICLTGGQVNFKPIRKADSWKNGNNRTEYGAWVRPVLADSKLGSSIYIYYGAVLKSSKISDCALQSTGYIGFGTNYGAVSSGSTNALCKF